jgi:hypothetical protein
MKTKQKLILKEGDILNQLNVNMNQMHELFQTIRKDVKQLNKLFLKKNQIKPKNFKSVVHKKKPVTESLLKFMVTYGTLEESIKEISKTDALRCVSKYIREHDLQCEVPSKKYFKPDNILMDLFPLMDAQTPYLFLDLNKFLPSHFK